MEELRIYGNDLAKVQVHWYSVIYFASQLYLQRYTFLFGYAKELLVFLCFQRDFLTCSLLFFRKSEFHVGKALAETSSDNLFPTMAYPKGMSAFEA